MSKVGKILTVILVTLYAFHTSYSIANIAKKSTSKVLTITTMFDENEYSETLIASKLALEHINQMPDILPGYYLEMTWRDTKVSRITL